MAAKLDKNVEGPGGISRAGGLKWGHGAKGKVVPEEGCG